MKSAPVNIVGIDMGNSSLKAVRLQKKGAQYTLSRVALIPNGCGIAGQAAPTEQEIAAQIRELGSMVKTAGADVHFSVNSTNSTVRYIELPHVPLEEIRAALKLNSTTYLRQSFENYIFDACLLDREEVDELSAKKGVKKGASTVHHGKVKMLVGGVFSSEVMLYFHAARRAGIKPRSLQLSPISLINGFEASWPDVFGSQAVALLDLGFASSSLTILDKGKPLLTRAVPTGGRQITEYIAQMTGADFARAEAAKLQGDANLGEAVSRTCVTLIREVRSSINFFEKNSDLPISKVYVTGASARSPAVVEALATDIGAVCEAWDAVRGLTIELPPEQQNIFTQNQPGFSAAMGTARTYAINHHVTT